MIDPNTPVVIGVGQSVDRWDGTDAGIAPSPISLAQRAASAALADTGKPQAVGRAIDRVAVVRTMADSLPMGAGPFGRCANPPATLAAGLGIEASALVYSCVGGEQPQTLVAEAAEAVFAGRTHAVLIAGGEATAALKTAIKRGVALDWSASTTGNFEDRGFGGPLLTAHEIAGGLGMPTTTYPAFENALRARLGHSRAEHRRAMAELLSGFSQVAADNPYAQFPKARTADFLATESTENYALADPYLKWHVAQDAVNQGAAVVVTTVGRATAMGVDSAKFVFLHGYAEVTDAPVLQRPDLSRSRAIEAVIGLALESAGRTAGDIAHLDLYSCFPCAILLAAEALGVDWRTRALTVTGGLPFFGGPGNNYAMHAIATLVERLRAERDAFGMVVATGGFLTKQAAGVYSAIPPTDWAPVSSGAIQRGLNATDLPPPLAEDAEGVIETYTVTMAKGVPSGGYAIAMTPKGRVLGRARSSDAATIEEFCGTDPIGRRIRICHSDGRNMVEGFIADAATALRD